MSIKCKCPQCVHLERDRDGWPERCGITEERVTANDTCDLSEIDRRRDAKTIQK